MCRENDVTACTCDQHAVRSSRHLIERHRASVTSQLAVCRVSNAERASSYRQVGYSKHASLKTAYVPDVCPYVSNVCLYQLGFLYGKQKTYVEWNWSCRRRHDDRCPARSRRYLYTSDAACRQPLKQ
jgi:hypothetical protein